MIPGRYNITCPQGSTLSKQLTYTIEGLPVNLYGHTARMQVREHHTSTAYIISLTTENGGLTLGGAAGTIIMDIEPSATKNIVAKEYVYDLELVVGAEVYRLIEGKFIVTPEVTR